MWLLNGRHKGEVVAVHAINFRVKGVKGWNQCAAALSEAELSGLIGRSWHQPAQDHPFAARLNRFHHLAGKGNVKGAMVSNPDLIPALKQLGMSALELKKKHKDNTE